MQNLIQSEEIKRDKVKIYTFEFCCPLQISRIMSIMGNTVHNIPKGYILDDGHKTFYDPMLMSRDNGHQHLKVYIFTVSRFIISK